MVVKISKSRRGILTDDLLNERIEMLEVVKNDVRAKYHDHVSHQRVGDFFSNNYVLSMRSDASL